MDDTTLYTADPDVISTTTGDELVLLSLKRETYYGLNAVGARIWELLQQGGSVATLCEVLRGEYPIEEEELRADIRALMQDLAQHSLLVLDPAEPIVCARLD